MGLKVEHLLRIFQDIVKGVARSENDFFDLFNLPHPGKYVVRLD